MKIDLKELQEAGIINSDTASGIEAFYTEKQKGSQNRLLITFSVLGALLVGLGIILIIAHNWEHFSRVVKTVFAFVPLLAAQAISFWVLLKRNDSAAWLEGSGTVLFLTVGACIALISQVYHISGDPGLFAMVWMLLVLPVVYIMRSSASSLMYIIGITWFAMETGYGVYSGMDVVWYWLLLALITPHFYMLERNAGRSHFALLHTWFLPASLILSLVGLIGSENGVVLLLIFLLLFSSLRLKSGLQALGRNARNGLYALGTGGVIVLLLVFTFEDHWLRVNNDAKFADQFIYFNEIIYGALFLIAALFLWFRAKNTLLRMGEQLLDLSFLIILPLYLVSIYNVLIPVLITNILVLTIGTAVIRRGLLQDNLGTLNFGLVMITALIGCRFFDFDLSFFARGVMFILTGAGFFAANYIMIKRRRNLEK